MTAIFGISDPGTEPRSQSGDCVAAGCLQVYLQT